MERGKSDFWRNVFVVSECGDHLIRLSRGTFPSRGRQGLGNEGNGLLRRLRLLAMTCVGEGMAYSY